MKNYRERFEVLIEERTQKLRENEETFRALTESSHDVIMRFDKNYRHLYVNPIVENQTGIPQKKFLGKTHKELGFPNHLVKIWEAAIKKVFTTGKPNRIEFKLPNQIWIDWMLVPEYDMKGKVAFVITHARDITKNKLDSEKIIQLNRELEGRVTKRTADLERANKKLTEEIKQRKISETKLLQEEKNYRSLFNWSPSGIMLEDIKGNIIDGNPALCRMLKYSKKELVKMNVKNLAYPGTIGNVQNNLSLLNKGKTLRHVVKNIRKDGSLCYMELHEKKISLGKGLDYILVIGNDITNQRKALEKLEENEFRYRTLFDLSPSGIMLENSNGVIIDINPALCYSLGYSKKEIIGKHVSILSPTGDKNEIEKNLKKILNGMTLKHIVNSRRKDGSLCYMELHEKKVPLADGFEGILVLSNDITERINHTRDLVNAKETAEKSNRIKSEFLAQMSHEIRSPINVILSFTSLLKEELGENMNEVFKTSFQSIERGGQRIIKTIDMILNMSEIQLGIFEIHPDKYDLKRDIFDDLMAEYRNYALGKGLQFYLKSEAQKTTIRADKYAVTQLFSNLLDNAIKYTKQGGVEICLENDENKNLIVKIKDTGIGISQRYIPQLFDAFTQEDTGYTRMYEGTGLGLALVKRYCEMNGAAIEVISDKGKGTTFIVSFKTV